MDEDGELSLNSLEIHVPGSASDSIFIEVEVVATAGIVSLPLRAMDSDDLVTATDTGAGVSVIGKIERVNVALRSLMYKPQADRWGTDEISVVAREKRMNKAQRWNEATGIEEIIVFIGPVNDPPVISVILGQLGHARLVASAGEFLPLSGITVRDPDASEPAGTDLVTMDITTGSTGNLVSFGLGTTMLSDQVPRMRWYEGSWEEAYPRITLSAPIEIANEALSFLQFLAPFGHPSGPTNVSITVFDNGNWGWGDDGSDEVNITINVRQSEDPIAVFQNSVRWLVPPGALSVEEDGRLRDLSIALARERVGVPFDTWVEAVVKPSHGTVQLVETLSVSKEERYNVEFARDVIGSISVSGALRDVSAAVLDLHYLPEQDFNGMEVLELVVHGAAKEWVVNSTLSILVLPRPDPPTVTVDRISPTNHSIVRTVEIGSRLELYGVNIDHVDALNGDSSTTLTMRAHSAAGPCTMNMDTEQQGLWVYTGDAAGDLVVRGTLRYLQLALRSGALEYMPLEGYDGIDTVTVSVSADNQFHELLNLLGENATVVQNYTSPEIAVTDFELTVIPAFIPPAVVFDDGPSFQMPESSAIQLTGIRVQAPGRRNTSETRLTVRLGTDEGTLTLPAVEHRHVIIKGEGHPTLTITATELDINMVLASTVFKGERFFNGIALVEVRFFS